uniref:Uncharacterized protein n=1 Tax=Nelumbo nucifera TaxID=4432 RepID=A0A822ZLK4_NELNU|nr:TPA_asm: hypothetical protein HUJ06_016881 [Nelumbo nucifera]
MEMYDEMQVVLGIDQAIGEDVKVGIELANETGIKQIGYDKNDVDIDNDALTPVFINEGTPLESNTQRKTTPSTSMKKRVHGNKTKSDDEFISAIVTMNEIMNKIAVALKVQSEQEFPKGLWNEVMDFDDFDHEELNEVFGYFARNDREAKIFLIRDKPRMVKIVHSITSNFP